MQKIKVNTSHNKYQIFEIVNSLPEIQDLKNYDFNRDYYYNTEICTNIFKFEHLDPEQPANDVYNYDLFELTLVTVSNCDSMDDIPNWTTYKYIAIKK